MNFGWDPHYLVRSYFDQRATWITADGRRLTVARMEPDHVLNCLLMLERVAADIEDYLRVRVQETELYASLKLRITNLIGD